jgi:hypothetical protein
MVHRCDTMSNEWEDKMAPRLFTQALSVMFLLVVTSSLMPVALAQTPAVDPQSLVGEREGQWKATKTTGRRAATGGRYYITVHRVDGNKVYFKELAVTPKAREEREREGVLNGNVLTYGSEGNFRFTIAGPKMTGESRTFQGGSEIELTKTK